MERTPFAEWLKQRDSELYNEISKKWLALPAALGIMYGGYRHSMQAPAYQGLPKPDHAITRNYEDPASQAKKAVQNAPIEIKLSGSGPISIHLDKFEIIGCNIDKVTQDAGWLANGVINRNALMKMAHPGKTGENETLSTGGGGEEIKFHDQDVTISIHDRTFTLTPDYFPSILRKVLNKPVNIHISDGWIKLHGTGSISISSGDSAGIIG